MIDQIGAGFSIASGIFGAIQNYRTLALSKKSLLRAYYFEVSANIDLLSIINVNKLTNTKVNDPEFASLVRGLDFQIAASILFGDGDDGNSIYNELYKLLEKTGNVKEQNEESGKVRSPIPKKSILQAMIFTIRRINILQKLVAVSAGDSEPENTLLHNLLLKVRITNIKNHLEFIKQELRKINKKEKFLITNMSDTR
jgi:hypothetical protein